MELKRIFLYFLATCLMATSYSRRPSKTKIEISKPSQVNVALNREQCQRSEFQSMRSCTRTIPSNPSAGRYLRPLRNLTQSTTAEKRPTAGPNPYFNPCKGPPQRVAVLAANDLNGVQRELVFDPDNLLYQTIIVENCDQSRFRNFRCRLQNITFEAVVFSTDPESDDVSIQDVTTPAYCALTTSLLSKSQKTPFRPVVSNSQKTSFNPVVSNLH